MSKFSIFTDCDIEEIREAPNFTGGWKVYFPTNFVKHYGDYINSIKIGGVKLTRAVDGRLMIGNEYGRKFFTFVRVKPKVNLKGLNISVEIMGRRASVDKFKFKVVEVGPRGRQFDYALMEIISKDE